MSLLILLRTETEVEPLPVAPGDNSELWELIYGSLGFHVEDDTDLSLRRLCEALCAPLQPVWNLLRDRPDLASWGVAFDPATSPAATLAYLAQFVGVQITPEMSEEQIRAEITHPTSWKRGQPESIRIATRGSLKPVVEGEELLVIIHPRTPEVGSHYVRTLLSQTPDPERARALIRAAVPAWEVLDYEAMTDPTWADLAASPNWTTWADLTADSSFANWQALTEITPDEL